MAQDRTKREAAPRLAPGSQAYSVEYFAEKHGISPIDARRLIKQHGNDRDAADKAANRLKR